MNSLFTTGTVVGLVATAAFGVPSILGLQGAASGWVPIGLIASIFVLMSIFHYWKKRRSIKRDNALAEIHFIVEDYRFAKASLIIRLWRLPYL
jgi:hypothetical protein